MALRSQRWEAQTPPVHRNLVQPPGFSLCRSVSLVGRQFATGRKPIQDSYLEEVASLNILAQLPCHGRESVLWQLPFGHGLNTMDEPRSSFTPGPLFPVVGVFHIQVKLHPIQALWPCLFHMVLAPTSRSWMAA